MNKQNRLSDFRYLFLTGLALSLILTLTSTTLAQYFGRNKVQYEDFDFKVLHTPHYRIYYYPQAEEAAADASQMAERWYLRLSNIFNHKLEANQPVIFYANHADFQQTNVIGGLISQGVGGVTESMKNRVVLPFTGSYAENNHVLGHELVHAFQYSILKSKEGKLSAARQMPLWFVEGMSEYLSLGRDYPLTTMWLRDALLHDKLPTISDMSGNPRYFPYRWGHAWWAYVTGRWGDETVAKLFRRAAAGDWVTLFEDELGMTADSLSQQWKEAIRERYQDQVDNRMKPTEVGRAALAEGDVNMVLSPSMSPDERYVAFIAQRDIFTLNLYLADLETGEVVRKLVSSNTDAHFDALRFMNSSGAWSPDGDRFAFVVFENGDNAVSVLDIESGDVKETFKLDSVDAVSHLAWSPDGSQLLISGSYGGIGDLYLYSFESGTVQHLTNDRFADLQPTWSPDGTTIAFATDRGLGTDFTTLDFRPLQLALMDVETRQMQYIAITDEAKHINPQFSPDGSSLYFVSDPEGVSDVFRYAIEDGDFYRVTHIATGVTGLTENSPALSVSRGSGDLAFTVFDDTEYKLRIIDAEDAVGEPYVYEAGEYYAGAGLPPRDDQSTVRSYLQTPTSGLPMAAGFEISDYDPSLSLAYAGTSGIGVAVDRFGAAVGGGASFLFTDMLGHRQLGITAQINGRLRDIGGEAFYINRRNRFNWGVAGGHIPFLSAFLRVRDTTITRGGEQIAVTARELIREWTFVDRAALLSEYPLSRNRRFEFSAGFSHIWYDLESDILFTQGGFVVDDASRDLAAPNALNLFHGSGAFVGDYSFFGFTSPIRGSRYRFEVEPTVGSLTFLTLTADYRKYFYLSPFTLAFRGLHQGRYLEDADDDRLTPLFVGYQTLVRGYNVYSFEPEECTGEDCAVFNRLIGSRIGIVNLEVRFPLFGTSEYGLVDFTYLPTELVAFFDGGVAWSAGEEPELKFDTETNERVPVFSAGVAARVNLLGYIVGQIYFAVPFQRPEKDTQFGFLIAPGW